jgi:hypothetical protein
VVSNVAAITGSQNIVIQDVLSSNVEINPPPPESTKDTQLYNVEIEGQNRNVIVAYNQKREPLWQKELDTRIRKLMVDDVDQEGTQEIIITTHEPGERPGWLLIFSTTGDLIYETNTWKPSIYYGGSKPQVNISDLKVVDLTNDGIKEIVITSQDVYWYASKVSIFQFLDRELKEVAEYWNPGLLNKLYIADLNNDQIQEVICVGENNDLQSVSSHGGNVFSVFLLDSSKIFGQAPPGFGDAAKGSEIWYGYVLPPGIGIAEVGFEDVDENGTVEVHISLPDHCSYYLDYEGSIIERGRGTGCKDESELKILR